MMTTVTITLTDEQEKAMTAELETYNTQVLFADQRDKDLSAFVQRHVAHSILETAVTRYRLAQADQTAAEVSRVTDPADLAAINTILKKYAIPAPKLPPTTPVDPKPSGLPGKA
jgi:hypothetical protein